MQEAILYAYDLTTVPSLLPAFANKRDLIVCDEVRAPHNRCCNLQIDASHLQQISCRRSKAVHAVTW